jgi:hypothetical protein
MSGRANRQRAVPGGLVPPGGETEVKRGLFKLIELEIADVEGTK